VENEILNLLTTDYFGFESDGSFPNGVKVSCNFIREYYPYNICRDSITGQYLMNTKLINNKTICQKKLN
jgi:hypothetical protein